MKGFGIEIKNNLLEPKHIENMDVAVWLYMWLVDKITSIDENGIGRVLGGRPVKFNEVKDELGISQNTYTRWIDKLLSYPYIEVKYAPYGIIFSVYKAHKKFGSVNRGSPEIKRGSPEMGRGSPETVNVIKTIQDSTKTLEKQDPTDLREEEIIPTDEEGNETKIKSSPRRKTKEFVIAIDLAKWYMQEVSKETGQTPAVDIWEVKKLERAVKEIGEDKVREILGEVISDGQALDRHFSIGKIINSKRINEAKYT